MPKLQERWGARGSELKTPGSFGGTLKDALKERSKPIVIDVIVTRDPSRMLPGVDARAAGKLKAGDRLI